METHSDAAAMNPPPGSSDGGADGGGGKNRPLTKIPKVRRTPIWRRAVVFLLKWAVYLGLGFVVVSAAAVLAFRWIPPPSTLNMAERAVAGVDVRRNWVSLDRISPNVVHAVIAAEDSRFCTHDGFDFVEIKKAIEESEDGGRQRGASTISQQTAKNVFLFNGGGFVRKGFEAWFTVLIERLWSKRRIIEVYLNVAEWGDGFYGVEAAARHRFHVTANRLSTRQSALLAAVLPSPNRWRLDPPGSYVRRRAGQIEQRMGVVKRDGLADCVTE